MKLIITFSTTTMALYMEHICKQKKMEGRLIPLPKEIDAGCGLAWMTKEMNKETWAFFLNENAIFYSEMVELEI